MAPAPPARPARVVAPGETLRFIVGEEESGQRLDSALAALAQVSRAQIRRWIETERVRLNGATCRPSRRLAQGDRVEARAPEPIAASVGPENIPLDVLFEDADLIVIDKPAGIVVHPAPGHPSGTLVNALLYHCGDLAGIGGVLRPGIVHRLDRGTSGALVAAKNDRAHQHLAGQFRDHSILRVYHAWVRSLPRANGGQIDRPLGRNPRDRTRVSVRRLGGRAARTVWRVLRRFPASGVSQLEVRPETGRTHQIRVHLASAGMSILGDPVYGRRRSQRRDQSPTLDRQALHAAILGFEHPTTGEVMRFESPLPDDLDRLREGLCRAEG